ncbi:alpha-L-arabinofuranosidase [Alloscardovia macacae]|uniref:non-reducing end alpha-L-arabinofuranosidase n=1 Tax=Alloscardovia macacae TaxID=1160091 RepID=A0A1Y2SY65_9BIFI|nr:alpha-L-arabinofuranosidase C-terminal domain-containing protein [Alloscardovia macacae]OTA26588.1 alpha-L-arabinofuranosidase [Alloscardovia macacae]OTA29024.1 alpha-L-arabinofuranosidase [Alloscardovia macacae]
MTDQPRQSAQEPLTARIIADDHFELSAVPDRIFGSFVEHLGRCVYEGIYEPGHPRADEDGFREDVLELVRELGATTIRYPGGNFVSGYRWEDGVGPRDSRPCRLETAWHSTETNEFGLHEMDAWLKKLSVDGRPNELMEAVNLGTRGLQEALDLVEYANVPGGTQLSEQRRANGADEPLNIRMWCLGNEMDGPWQLGHKSAENYGTLAADVARGIRQIDPNVELVVCGSSGHNMPTFGQWEDTVLSHTYDLVDFVSCHAYYEPARYDGDMQSFLASGVDMDGFIKEVGALIDAAKAKAKSAHDVYISFDEWNVWYQSAQPSVVPAGIGNWPVAPHLLEDLYTAADAVVFGDLLITLLKNADRVKSASLAQLVNVIAPIMTQRGGDAWRQTTFYPFSLTARLAKGGTVLAPKQTSTLIQAKAYGDVESVNSVVIKREDGSYTVFLTNRSLDTAADVEIVVPSDFAGSSGFSEVEATTLHDDDLSAANTAEHQDRVTPARNDTARLISKDESASGGAGVCGETRVKVTLPAVSWTAVVVR